MSTCQPWVRAQLTHRSSCGVANRVRRFPARVSRQILPQSMRNGISSERENMAGQCLYLLQHASENRRSRRADIRLVDDGR